MESIMLGHIMNLATIMRDNPEEILVSDLANSGLLVKIQDLGYKPIHPTDAFQYIVGKWDERKKMSLEVALGRKIYQK